MKNLIIITPFYPYPKKKFLKKDTNAIYYLIANKTKNEKVTIVYYYQHTRLNAIKNLPRILNQRQYEECLYEDDNGNDVLLFEHPCLKPHSYKTMTYFDKKYTKFLNRYLMERSIVVDSLVVHFPIRFTPIARRIDSLRKVAIFHSFDVSEDKIQKTREYSKSYDELGFRSPNIRDKFYSGSKEKDFLCISGVPNKYIEKTALSRPWKPNGVLNICFVGRLDKNKNVKNVLFALNNVKDKINFRFSIIGEGPELNNLIELSRKLEINDKVIFLGKMMRDDVFLELKNNNVFIMTSFKETLGIAYLEAMAAGNLVIASKNQGIDGLIKDGHGVIFVNPSSINSISSAIEKYYYLPISKVILLREEIYSFIIKYTENFTSRAYLNMAFGQVEDIKEG